MWKTRKMKFNIKLVFWITLKLVDWGLSILQIFEITEEKFFEPIKDDYIRSLSKMGMAEFDDGYNPGNITLFLEYIYLVCRSHKSWWIREFYVSLCGSFSGKSMRTRLPSRSNLSTRSQRRRLRSRCLCRWVYEFYEMRCPDRMF